MNGPCIVRYCLAVLAEGKITLFFFFFFAGRRLTLAGVNSWETKVCMKNELFPLGHGYYGCKTDEAIAGPSTYHVIGR